MTKPKITYGFLDHEPASLDEAIMDYIACLRIYEYRNDGAQIDSAITSPRRTSQ